jgi:hypothetical protein
MADAAEQAHELVRQAIAAARGSRLEPAREALERAVELCPENRDAFALLAAVHLQRGDSGLAGAALEEAGVDAARARRMLDDLCNVMTPAELAEAVEVAAAEGPMRVLGGNVLSVSSGPTSHARLSSVLVYEGAVVCEAAPRRKNGQIEPAAGEWASVYQVGGSGRVVLAAAGRVTVLELRDEGVFLREACVDAFEGPLVFENGRLPGGGPPIVYLCGRGRVALRTGGRLRALRLAPGARAQVALDALEGFFGGLFVRALPAAEGEPVTAVCEGEGTLLLRAPE